MFPLRLKPIEFALMIKFFYFFNLYGRGLPGKLDKFLDLKPSSETYVVNTGVPCYVIKGELKASVYAVGDYM